MAVSLASKSPARTLFSCATPPTAPDPYWRTAQQHGGGLPTGWSARYRLTLTRARKGPLSRLTADGGPSRAPALVGSAVPA